MPAHIFALGGPDMMKIRKIMKFMISGSQDTVSKPQSAAQTRNVEITCRGADSPSVSNTRRRPGDLEEKLISNFKIYSNPIVYFSSD